MPHWKMIIQVDTNNDDDMGEAQNQGTMERRKEIFKKIWKLKVLKKVAIFLWKCIHNILPTRHELRRRHMSDEAYCTRCGNGAETLLHVLRDCPSSERIWDCIGQVTNSGDLYDWFEQELTSRESGRQWKFAATVYHIWWFRNVYVKKKQVIPLKEQYNTIMRFMIKYEAEDRKRTGLSETTVEWGPLEGDIIKINFDGSFISHNLGGAVGVVMRNSAGELGMGVPCSPGSCQSSGF